MLSMAGSTGFRWNGVGKEYNRLRYSRSRPTPIKIRVRLLKTDLDYCLQPEAKQAKNTETVSNPREIVGTSITMRFA
jgi:hypothetical protein